MHRLNMLLVKCNLRHSDIAQMTQYSQRTIVNYCNGHTKPPADVLEKVEHVDRLMDQYAMRMTNPTYYTVWQHHYPELAQFNHDDIQYPIITRCVKRVRINTIRVVEPWHEFDISEETYKNLLTMMPKADVISSLTKKER